LDGKLDDKGSDKRNDKGNDKKRGWQKSEMTKGRKRVNAKIKELRNDGE
jgi:hypothetical protein